MQINGDPNEVLKALGCMSVAEIDSKAGADDGRANIEAALGRAVDIINAYASRGIQQAVVLIAAFSIVERSGADPISEEFKKANAGFKRAIKFLKTVQNGFSEEERRP